MIDVDLDFIIKGIESQGATCITEPRNARLQMRKGDFYHNGKAFTFISEYDKKEFTLFVANEESQKFHCLTRTWNMGNLPQVFWFIEGDNILSYIEGMCI